MRSVGAPAANSVEAAMDTLRMTAMDRRDGVLADYIPVLAHADPELFGLALASTEGHIYESGDSRTRFSVQSISKPLVYALALDRLGLDAVHAVVGSEPSGEAFNAVSLDDGGRPRNPMINAGAIATTALLRAGDGLTRFDAILSGLSGFVGRQLDVDLTVFDSEQQTAHRNRGLAHLMAASGALGVDPDAAVEDYIRQCSVSVDTVDLAVAAATLASGGVNPVSGDRVVSPDAARHALSLMASCGMYDHAGEWMLRVGLPAKSGVSGGIIAATPGRMGIGVFAPPLDAAGNSVRGVAALTQLSERYGLHMLNLPRRAPSFTVESTANDSGDSGASGRILRVTVRGDIDFVDSEALVSHLADLRAPAAPDVRQVIVDLSAAVGVAPIAAQLLREESRFLRGITMTIIEPSILTRPADPA